MTSLRVMMTALGLALPAVSGGQVLPDVSVAAGEYVLTVPYLEFGSGASKVAYGAVFRSRDLSLFTLDARSVTSQAPLAAAIDSPTVAPVNGGYRFTVPRLGYGAGSSAVYYAAAFTTTDLSRFTLDASTVRQVSPPSGSAGPTGVTAANTGERTVGSTRIYSSSTLSVSWTAPPGSRVDHYEITAAETVYGTSTTATASAGETSMTIAGLKAATPYSITVKACGDGACGQSGTSSAVTATTPEEYWQLQGSGNSVAGLTRIVSDGNARISATRFGPDAGDVNASRIQLYYGPMAANPQALATAVTSQATDASVASSYLGFTSMAGTTGLISPTTATSLVTQLATGQGVALSAGMGGKVRLFFEALGSDNRTRIMFLDSQDGYAGRDFNAGSSAICTTAADYQSGGGCAPTVAIGVEGDTINANSRIRNARQFKLGYPILDDWRWNGEAGTFMVFTTDNVSGCSTSAPNHGYAAWVGSQWQVQYTSGGCPKLFASAQAMFPMHVGGARYKMYFGDPSVTTGRVSGSMLPFLGPKKLIYADGGSTGSASVDFEDWESTAAARNVIFLWPNGDQLNDGAEGYIDDFHFLAPTGSLDLQVMYMAITEGAQPPIGAAAVLLNP